MELSGGNADVRFLFADGSDQLPTTAALAGDDSAAHSERSFHGVLKSVVGKATPEYSNSGAHRQPPLLDQVNGQVHLITEQSNDEETVSAGIESPSDTPTNTKVDGTENSPAFVSIPVVQELSSGISLEKGLMTRSTTHAAESEYLETLDSELKFADKELVRLPSKSPRSSANSWQSVPSLLTFDQVNSTKSDSARAALPIEAKPLVISSLLEDRTGIEDRQKPTKIEQNIGDSEVQRTSQSTSASSVLPAFTKSSLGQSRVNTDNFTEKTKLLNTNPDMATGITLETAGRVKTLPGIQELTQIAKQFSGTDRVGSDSQLTDLSFSTLPASSDLTKEKSSMRTFSGSEKSVIIPIQDSVLATSDQVELNVLRSGMEMATAGSLNIAGFPLFTPSGQVSVSSILATPELPSSVDLMDQLMPEKLGGQIRVMIDGGVQKAIVQVKPAELGPVQIEMLIENEKLTVNINAHQAATKELLESVIPRLRESLGSQQFTQIDVSVSQDNRESTQSFLQSNSDREDSKSQNTKNDQAHSEEVVKPLEFNPDRNDGHIDAYA